MRQIADESQTVKLAKSYDPYGNVIASMGSGASIFGFTGEQVDSYIKLLYLRSRMYDPAAGRFITKDSWQGDDNRPASYNAWLYVYANPVNFTDPSGHDPWWCEGQSNEDICYAKWVVAHGGRLTSNIRLHSATAPVGRLGSAGRA